MYKMLAMHMKLIVKWVLKMFCFDCLNICKFIKSSFTCKVIVEYLSHVIFYKLNVNLNCNIDASANKNYHLEVNLYVLQIIKD